MKACGKEEVYKAFLLMDKYAHQGVHPASAGVQSLDALVDYLPTSQNVYGRFVSKS